MKKLFKNYYVNMFIIISLSLLVLYFTVGDNISNVKGIIASMSPLWVLILAVFILLQQLLIGYLIAIITQKIYPNYRVKEGFINSLIAAFFHGITPSASGGQFAQAYVHKKQNVKVSDSASILWLEFVIYQSVMVLVVAALLLLYGPEFATKIPKAIPFILLGFLISMAVIVGLWLITSFDPIYRWITTKGVAFLAKIKVIKDPDHAVEGLNKQIQIFNHNTVLFKQEYKLILKLSLLNIARNIMSFIFPALVALSLGLRITVTDLIPIMALTAAINMVNSFIPIPGASGGSEALFILFFASIYEKTVATSMMIVWRFFSYYFLMIVGGITFMIFQKKHGKFLKVKEEVV